MKRPTVISHPRLFKAKVALLIASTGLALLCFEMIVRVLRLAPAVIPLEVTAPFGSFIASDNPVLKYVPKPGSRDISSYGIRDREYSLRKPNDTYRIVVIGDSIAFGYCTDQGPLDRDEVVAKILERSLNARRIRGYSHVEVLNLGVSGYDTLQESEFLRLKGLPLHPDLVVVAYCLNDTAVVSWELHTLTAIAGEDGLRPPAPPWLSRGMSRSALARFLWQRWSLLLQRADSGEGRDIPMAGFRKIREMSEEAGFRVLVVVFPFLTGLQHYGFTREHEAVRVKARSNGFLFLDLQPVFSGADNAQAIQGRCASEHPDILGHRIAAAEIEKVILEKILIAH